MSVKGYVTLHGRNRPDFCICSQLALILREAWGFWEKQNQAEVIQLWADAAFALEVYKILSILKTAYSPFGLYEANWKCDLCKINQTEAIFWPNHVQIAANTSSACNRFDQSLEYLFSKESY